MIKFPSSTHTFSDDIIQKQAKFDKAALHRRPEFSTIPPAAPPPSGPSAVAPLPQSGPRSSVVATPIANKPGIPSHAKSGLHTPIQTPQQQKQSAQPPHLPPPLFPALAHSIMREGEKPECAQGGSDDNPLLHGLDTSVTSITKVVPEDDDPDFGAHFFGSDDDALFAEMDLNAESYINPSSCVQKSFENGVSMPCSRICGQRWIYSYGRIWAT